jgi:PAS domain S-box-containing protein
MAGSTGRVGTLAQLRRKAEARLAAKEPAASAAPGDAELKRLVHELEVHQAALELQNEQLREAQLELEASRARYQQLFDHAPVGYLTLDRAGRITEANLAAVRLLGLPRNRLVNRRLSSFMGREDGDVFHYHREQIFEQGRAFCDLQLKRPDGQVFPAHLDSTPVYDDAGQPIYSRTALIDLSELREAQAGLRTQEALFNLIASHVEDVFYVLERGGRISYLSPAFERVWGRLADEGRESRTAWLDAVVPQDRPRVVAAFEALLRGDPFDEEYRIERPGGEIVWLRDRAFPIEEGGAVDRYAGIIQDVTAERQLEEELRQAQKMEAIGTLASGIAHDFRNVLQGILGCVHLALQGNVSPERARTYLERAGDAARRGAGLTEQLMAFGRKEKAQPRPVGFDQSIEESASLIERLVGEHIRLELETAAPHAVVIADPVQLQQILMNLAANARDAMPQGGTLTLRTEVLELDAAAAERHVLPHAGRYVKLAVRDTGVGIDESVRRRIFEPFFTTKEVGKGTGLGLATTFAILRRLGGHIEVESEPGKGSEFILLLPCAEAAATPVESEPPPGAEAAGTALLVEDDATVRLAMREYLGELGFRVIEAQSGDEALRIVQEGRAIDLLVSDVMMPGLTGGALAQRLSARDPHLATVLVSAHSVEDLVSRHLVARGVPVLRKPFDREELAQVIAQARKRTRRTTLLLVEDDDDARQALRDCLEDAGYAVLAAARPSQALELATRHAAPIDLVVSDVRLPEMNGHELVRRLRELRAGLRVVFMSGIAERGGQDADAFLTKPIDAASLTDTLCRVLAAGASG